MASSLNDAMNTRVTTAVAASRPLAASTTPTPVMTSWLRPRRRRSMARASSWLVGFPSGWWHYRAARRGGSRRRDRPRRSTRRGRTHAGPPRRRRCLCHDQRVGVRDHSRLGGDRSAEVLGEAESVLVGLAVPVGQLTLHALGDESVHRGDILLPGIDLLPGQDEPPRSPEA